jgi:hypothetical protein
MDFGVVFGGDHWELPQRGHLPNAEGDLALESTEEFLPAVQAPAWILRPVSTAKLADWRAKVSLLQGANCQPILLG